MTDQPSAEALTFMMTRAGCKERCVDKTCDCVFAALDCDAFAARAVAASRQPMSEQEIIALWNETMDMYVSVVRELIPNGPSHQAVFAARLNGLLLDRYRLGTASERASLLSEEDSNDETPLPCPCCGGRPEIQIGDQPRSEGGQFIECSRCGLTTPLYFDRCENMIPNWNRRTHTASERTKPDAGDLERAKERIAELEKLVYVPGAWRCAKCEFVLFQSNLNARDGTITARDDPGDKCPNCDSPLWRITWQQDAKDLGKRLEEFLERERLALAEASRAGESAGWDAAVQELRNVGGSWSCDSSQIADYLADTKPRALNPSPEDRS